METSYEALRPNETWRRVVQLGFPDVIKQFSFSISQSIHIHLFHSDDPYVPAATAHLVLHFSLASHLVCCVLILTFLSDPKKGARAESALAF